MTGGMVVGNVTSILSTPGYEDILTETADGVGIIILNRPDKLNAMNRRLAHELHTAVKAMEADPDIGCIVITGAGERAFSAGGDIHEQLSDDARYTQEQLDAMRSGRPSYDIAARAKPTIGMMNGLAYGGAAVLAAPLDTRVGCEATKFRCLAAAYGRINATWSLPCPCSGVRRDGCRDAAPSVTRSSQWSATVGGLGGKPAI